jgi:Lar family restriction alleviation protein
MVRMANNHDLKPCPFCGNKPNLRYDRLDNFYIVKCDSSECPINPDTAHCDTEEGAIECWNSRENSSVVSVDNQLKPCPFCGETPITEIGLARYGRLGDCITIRVVCAECHVAKSIYIREGTDFGTVKESMGKIIEEWNTRELSASEVAT